MSVILRHESFSPNLNFALINIWVICWSFLGHLWSLKNSAQIDMSVECGQKGTPGKVSKSGNFSTFEKFPGMEELTNKLFTSTESYDRRCKKPRSCLTRHFKK
jgi:hypothetical protein